MLKIPFCDFSKLLLVKTLCCRIHSDMVFHRCGTSCVSVTQFIYNLVLKLKSTYLKTRCLEETFTTVLTEVSSLIIVLFSMENGGVSVAKLSTTVFTLKYHLYQSYHFVTVIPSLPCVFYPFHVKINVV